MFRKFCYPFNRPETTSEVYPKCQRKICTPFLLKLAQMVRGNLCSPVYPAAGSAKLYHTDFDVSSRPPQQYVFWKRCCFWIPSRG